MDISLLRKRPEDRIRTIRPFIGDTASVEVLFASRDDLARIADIAKGLQARGENKDDAYHKAYGRIGVRGWSELSDGTELLPFTPENCDFLMIESAEFRREVIAAATCLKVDSEKN